MIKKMIRGFARRFGVNFCSTDHLGVDVELDLARLTADQPIRQVFDVGGNFGQTALRFADAFESAKVFTFEPVPPSYKRLMAAVAGNNRIKAFNIALGDTTGSIKINLTPSAGSNTILSAQSVTGGVDVPIETIDSFAAKNSIECIDLLKIDVEGYELQVIEGARGIIQKGGVRYVFAECVIPEDRLAPHTRFFDLHNTLSDYGYCFVSYYGEGFRLSDGCALGNVLYALRSALPRHASGRVKNIA